MKKTFLQRMGLDKNAPLKVEPVLTPESQAVIKEGPSANWLAYPAYRNNISTYSFNGEKNLGEAGPIVHYLNDYVGLRARSWQAMYESDKAQIGINRLVKYIVGKGLKPQCEPMDALLKDEGVTFDKKKFADSVEARFNLFLNSKEGSYSGMFTPNELAAMTEKNSMVGGDILTILRYQNGKETIQLIDGEHVMSPYYGTEYYPQKLPDGHRLINGIEVDNNGRHIAFYVRTYALTGNLDDLFAYRFERVQAYGESSGLEMAWMYYGSLYRLDDYRGMPIISACIEKLKKMEEYSDATLNQAKEAAKVDYQVTHDLNAEGKAPWAKSTVAAYNVNNGVTGNSSMPVTDDGVQLNKTVHITSIGTAYNNNPGSKLEMLKNENPLYFKDFIQTHSNEFFAVIDIPPNVAMGLYTDSYSASRASVMDWLNTLIIKRDHLKVGWLQKIYNFWLEIQIYKNKIQAPGYLTAKMNGNNTIIDAYRCIRFIGVNPPHIDPKVEAEAARVLLGPAFANVPLSDVEKITESLGQGNANENIEQAAKELDKSKKLNIKPDPIEQKVVNDNTNRNKGTKKPKVPAK